MQIPIFDISNIKLIVGLGNIGKNYEKTRHNVGFMLVDATTESEWKEDKKLLASIAEVQRDGRKLIFAKPTTMMNDSGKAVRLITQYYKIKPAEVLVAYDDLDIQFGNFKIQFGREPKVHNGISSINRELNTNEYWRIRIGVDNREVKGNKGIPGMRYVLERFTAKEQQELQKTIFPEIQESL